MDKCTIINCNKTIKIHYSLFVLFIALFFSVFHIHALSFSFFYCPLLLQMVNDTKIRLLETAFVFYLYLLG